MTTAAGIVVAPAAPDLAAVKARQQATWASGNFAIIGRTLQIVGEMSLRAAAIPRSRWFVEPDSNSAWT